MPDLTELTFIETTSTSDDLSFIETSATDEIILSYYKELDFVTDKAVKAKLPDAVFGDNIDSSPHASSLIYLIKLNNQPIGFLEMSFESMYITNMVYLMSLYVVPDYRRRGVGTAAINFFKAGIAMNRNIKYVSVHCHENDKLFYEKNGFTSEVWLTRICSVNK